MRMYAVREKCQLYNKCYVTSLVVVVGIYQVQTFKFHSARFSSSAD